MTKREILTSEHLKKIFIEELEKKLKEDEWQKKLVSLKKELDGVNKKEKEKEIKPKRNLLTSGLEIKDKDGNLFTVKKDDGNFIWLQNPVGKFLKIDASRLRDFRIE